MKPDVKTTNLQHGFTLVELMVTLVIAFVISGAAYAAYVVQQRSYTVQEQVAEIQQNIRTGVDLMSREMRMLGYDPSFSGQYGIVAANSNSLNFTADLCNDGGVPGTCVIAGENITETYLYQLYDSSGDGVNDALRRTPGGAAVSENIEQLEFYYTLRDGTQTLNPTAAELGQIVTVDISILARSAEEDFNYTDTGTYTTASGQIFNILPANNRFRRRMLITTLQLRNMSYGT